MRECNRCLLNDEIPGVQLSREGQCSVCSAYDATWGDWPSTRPRRQAELERLLDAARRAGRRYDALVPLSGGKDSTYILYLARKRFGLRCLSVTYDNGFLSDHARANIRNAVDRLGADHMFLRLSWPLQQRLYRTFFLKTGFFCPACMSGISWAIDSAATAYRVPLILEGRSLRTEEHVAPEFFVPGDPDFYRAVLEGEDDLARESPIAFEPTLARRVLTRFADLATVEKIYFGASIRLPDYVDWDYDEIFRTITNELGWRGHKADAEHTDCTVDPAVDYIRRRKYPALIPELTRYSKLVTIGKMTKEEARARLPAKEEPLAEPPSLDVLLRALDVSRAQLESVLAEPRRHLPYLSKHYGLRARARAALEQLTGR